MCSTFTGNISMFKMKKFLTLSLILFIALTACKKDEIQKPAEQIPAYEQRLLGDWSLQAVQYDGLVPNPLDPLNPIELKGNGSAISGGHTVSRNPNKIDFNYSFTAQVDFNGFPLPIPINQEGIGEWTLNENGDRIFITEEGEETIAWKILVNETNKQVYAAQVSQQVQGGITVTIDTELTFVK